MTLSKILSGDTVDLLPLERKHFGELEIIAAEKKIWEFYTIDGSEPPKLREALNTAMTEMERGIQLPFVIFHKAQNKLIGSTRFLDIQLHNRKLEIGWTWLHPDYWATVVNPQCKILLLTYCFEELDLVRVQFKTDENNLRSRNAIEKVGGKFEGVLRNDMIRDNGTKRNSAYYSIIDSEWPVVKMKLKKQIINLGAG